MTNDNGLVLQTIYYPFEVYSRTCGDTALDVYWDGSTFSGGGYSALRSLDVSATLHQQGKYVSVYVVNRSQTEPMETAISLDGGQFTGSVQAYVVNGPDIKAENTFAQPDQVRTGEKSLSAEKHTFTFNFEPHSVTALICAL